MINKHFYRLILELKALNLFKKENGLRIIPQIVNISERGDQGD